VLTENDYEEVAEVHGVPSLAAFPGSYNPPTIAHLAMAEATVRRCAVDRVDLVLSRSALGKEDVIRPTVDERAEVLRAVASTRPWLGVVVTDDRLLADIAASGPYDVLVLGADKWAQVLDPAFYGGSVEAMEAAVARLPRLAIAPRLDHDLPDGAHVTVLDVQLHDVSSTAPRSGAREVMLAEAVASGLW
jgi:nicotinic acid mononucleotide adenylyltransferase